MADANRTKCLHIALLMLGLSAPTGTLSAQETVKHLNPVIEKLAAGQPSSDSRPAICRSRTPAASPAPTSTTCIWRWSTGRWISRGCTASRSA